jgi:ABC-type Mn2+/Zn2+ transport system permease subunit
MSALAEVWNAVSDPWGQAIMQRALLEVTLLGVVGGALGCWIVFYQLSYSAESLAHALLPGLVLATLTGIPLLAGGAVGLLAAAIAIGLAERTPGIEPDTAVAVVISSLFGLGVLLALSPSSPPGIRGILFGDVLGVSDTDLLLAAILATVVIAALRLLHGQLLAVGFDRMSARALGARPPLVETALLVLIALAILVAVQGLGNLLVLAVLIGPASTARLVCRRMPQMMVIAALLAVGGAIGGLYLSYYAGTAAGASIAGTFVVVFLAAVCGTWVKDRATAGRPIRRPGAATPASASP